MDLFTVSLIIAFVVYIATLCMGVAYAIVMKGDRDWYIQPKIRRLYISLLVILPVMIAAVLAFWFNADVSADEVAGGVKLALFLTATLFVNLVNLPLILALVVLPCSRERERAEKLMEERRNEISSYTSGVV